MKKFLCLCSIERKKKMNKKSNVFKIYNLKKKVFFPISIFREKELLLGAHV